MAAAGRTRGSARLTSNACEDEDVEMIYTNNDNPKYIDDYHPYPVKKEDVKMEPCVVKPESVEESKGALVFNHFPAAAISQTVPGPAPEISAGSPTVASALIKPSKVKRSKKRAVKVRRKSTKKAAKGKKKRTPVPDVPLTQSTEAEKGPTSLC